MNIEQFVSEYLADRSAYTRKAYRSDLKLFGAFLHELGLSETQLTVSHFRQFAAWVRNAPNARTKTRGQTDTSVQRRLAAVRAYYNWLEEKDDTIRNLATKYRFRRTEDEREVQPVSSSDIKTMCGTSRSKRNVAIVELLYRSGIRLDELVQLDKNSIEIRQHTDPAGRTCVIGSAMVTGKGRKKRRILINETALMAISNYLLDRGDDAEPALFLSRRHKRISKRMVEALVAQMSTQAGVEHVHPHRFRHSFATEMSNAGMRDMVLQKLAGHKHLVTLGRYIKVTDLTAARQYHAVMQLLNDGAEDREDNI